MISICEIVKKNLTRIRNRMRVSVMSGGPPFASARWGIPANQEQKEQNTTETYDYDETMDALQEVGQRFASAGKMEELTEIVEQTLGRGGRVSECSKSQIQAMVIILDDLRERADELGI